MNRLLIVDNAEPQDKAFNEPLIQGISRITEADVINFRDISEHDDIAARYGGVILSGVPLTYEFDTIDEKLPYMRRICDAPIPVLGICLGHQAMGRLFDVELRIDKEVEIGVQSIDIQANDALFAGLPARFKVGAMHSGSIPVPREFTLLASSPGCNNQVMKHNEKPLYGTQFHPEWTTSGLKMLENFVALM